MSDLGQAVSRFRETAEEYQAFRGLNKMTWTAIQPLLDQLLQEPVPALTADDYAVLYGVFSDVTINSALPQVTDFAAAVQFMTDGLQVAQWAHEQSPDAGAAYIDSSFAPSYLAYWAQHAETMVKQVLGDKGKTP